MLEDKEGKLTFQQVIQSPVADEFHFNQSKDNQFDYHNPHILVLLPAKEYDEP